MLKQLSAEADKDEEVYDQIACWCETNEKEKTKSIAEAKEKIAELTAASARLTTEIKNLENEVAKDQ